MELREWQQQWLLVHSDPGMRKTSTGSLVQLESNYGGDAGKAEILMEYARQRNPINKVCFPKQKSELFGFRVSNDADILFSNLTL